MRSTRNIAAFLLGVALALAGATLAQIGGPSSGLKGAPPVPTDVARVLHAVKTADTSRSSTTTLADDPHLTLALAASTTYIVEVFASWTHPVSIAGGFKVKPFAYSGTLTRSKCWGVQTTSVAGEQDYQPAFDVAQASDSIGINAAGVLAPFMTHCLVQTSTAGTLSFQWAQTTSDVNAVVVQAGSYLRAIR